MSAPSATRSAAVVLLVCICLSILHNSRVALRQSSLKSSSHTDEPLYLPSAEYVKLITLGFDAFASHILWFETISYFGKHYRGDQDYHWLGEMCHIVTKLNQRALHVYEFCGTLLSWVAKDVDASDSVLTEGIKTNPGEWKLWYLRGFNQWYFRGRRDLASSDLARAANLPGSPPFLASMASRLITDSDGPASAVAFLADMLKRTKDDSVRQVLEDRLKRAILSRDLRFLHAGVEKYRERYGEPPEKIEDLVIRNIINRLPQEPFGGKYLFIQSDGRVISTSGEKGLEFFGKTADTGMFRSLNGD